MPVMNELCIYNSLLCFDSRFGKLLGTPKWARATEDTVSDGKLSFSFG